DADRAAPPADAAELDREARAGALGAPARGAPREAADPRGVPEPRPARAGRGRRRRGIVALLRALGLGREPRPGRAPGWARPRAVARQPARRPGAGGGTSRQGPRPARRARTRSARGRRPRTRRARPRRRNDAPVPRAALHDLAPPDH